MNINKLDNLPDNVRLKEYKNGIAVELKYGFAWLNLHSLLYEFPDTYYFKTKEDAMEIHDEIVKRMRFNRK